jgi:hypothetical protein
MATYKEIQDDIRRRYGRSIKSCWIAHVKELNGIAPRRSSNRIDPNRRMHPCPMAIRPIIEESMRRFRMIQ